MFFGRRGLEECQFEGLEDSIGFPYGKVFTTVVDGCETISLVSGVGVGGGGKLAIAYNSA